MVEIASVKHYCDRNRIPFPEFSTSYCFRTKAFVCKTALNGEEVEATGLSKKIAKHEAARKLWDIIKDDNRPTPQTASDGRHVRKMNELCQREGCPMPTFTVIREIGPSNRKTFTMECRFADLRTEAEANTKKDAKDACCRAMLPLLETKRWEVPLITLFHKPNIL